MRKYLIRQNKLNTCARLDHGRALCLMWITCASVWGQVVKTAWSRFGPYVTAGDKLIVLKANAGMTLCRAFAVVIANIHSNIRVEAVRSVEQWVWTGRLAQILLYRRMRCFPSVSLTFFKIGHIEFQGHTFCLRHLLEMLHAFDKWIFLFLYY